MAYDLLESLSQSQAAEKPTVVNQSSGYNILDFYQPPTPAAPKTPETWTGEATAGFSRGIDEIQQMLYGAGALGASWLGAENAKEWFLKGYNLNEKEIAANPATVGSYEDVSGVDSAIRYGLASASEMAPQIGVMLGTSVVGEGIGVLAAATDIGETIGQGAVKKMLLNRGIRGEVRDEIKDYLAGKVEKAALSERAATLVDGATVAKAKQIGSLGAQALSSIQMETGSIYGDMVNNPDIPESDKRWAASLGGLVASIPDTFVSHWIAGKILGKSAEKLTTPEVGSASGYFVRFMTKAAKEIAKIVPVEMTEEFFQTGVELASQNWADPATRYDFLNFTPEQWTSMIDAGIRGGIGGILPGVMTGALHPDPKVRSTEREVLQKANDVKLNPADFTGEHEALSQAQQAVLAAESNPATDPAQLEALKAQEEAIRSKVFPEPVLVNQNTPVSEPVETPKPTIQGSTADQELTRSLEASYSEIMPTREVSPEAFSTVRPSEAQLKSKENELHIEKAHGDSDTGVELRDILTNPKVTTAMADNDIELKTDESGKLKFGAKIEGDGIKLYIPDVAASEKEIAALQSSMGLNDEQTRKVYNEGIRKSVEHELIHSLDLANIKDEWKSSGSTDTLAAYADNTHKERGRILREADPLLPRVFKAAYHYGDVGSLSDIQLGQELPRMAVEMGRNGQTTEATESLAIAAQKNGKLNMFLRTWIDALKKAAGYVKKLLGSNPELKKVYDNINAALDNYGLIQDGRPVTLQVPAEALVNQSSTPGSKQFKGENEGQAILDAVASGQKPLGIVTKNEAERASEMGLVTKKNKLQLFVAKDKTTLDANVTKWFDLQRSVNAGEITTKEYHQGTGELLGFTQPEIDDFNSQYGNQETKFQSKALVNQNENKTQSQPAEKASIGEEDTSGHDGDVQSDSRGDERFNHPSIKAVAKEVAASRPGIKLETLKAKIDPSLLVHVENIQKQLTGSTYLPAEAPIPIRGEANTKFIQENEHVVYIGYPITDDSRKFAEARGLKIIGEGDEIPSDAYIIDTNGIVEQMQGIGIPLDNVNQDSSVIWPVNMTDKLIEAHMTDGIPESHALVDLGHETIDAQTVTDLDGRFGPNGWILKNFSEDARQGRDVYHAEAVKNALRNNEELFKGSDTTQIMVQRLHNTLLKEGRGQNIKILPKQELRVHVLTDTEGNAHILPSTSFWKLPTWEQEANPLEGRTPIMVEDKLIQAAYERALSSIQSLPIEERSGQFFGMDLIRLRDGGWGTVEANPIDHTGQSGYFTSSPLAHDSYMAALLGERPVHQELAQLVHEAMVGDALVNQRIEYDSSTPAEAAQWSDRAQRELEREIKDVNQQFEKQHEELKRARVRTEQRGAQGTYQNFTQQAAEYKSQPQTDAMRKAQSIISENGLMDVINTLLRDPTLKDSGAKYNIAEYDEILGVPNATFTALYDNVSKQLDALLGKLKDSMGDRKVRMWLADTAKALRDTIQTVVLPIARATSISGKLEQVMNASAARRSLVEPLLNHLDKVLGKNKGARFIAMMTTELNKLMSDHAARVVTTPQVIAQLQKIIEVMHTKKGHDAARRTAVMTEAKARRFVKSMAARMADHQANDPNSPEFLDMAAKRMIKMFDGIPTGSEKKTEVQLFMSAVNQVVRENADALGLRGENQTEKVSDADKLAAILKNDDIYHKFVETIHAQAQAEYKPEAGSPFAQQLTELRQNLHDKAWSQGMVDALVNQNLREYETTFSKLSREHYGLSDYRVEDFKESVRQAMRERGVENEALLAQLVDDAEGAMRSHLEDARLQFLGGGTGIREFLKHAQASLADLAKDHPLSKNDIPERLSDWLQDYYGIPNTSEFPLADELHDVVMNGYNDMLAAKRKEIVQRYIDSASSTKPEAKAKLHSSIAKIVELTNLGVMRDEETYNKLAEKFGLPKFNTEVVMDVEALGAVIATAPNDRIKNDALQTLSMLIASQKGITPYDMFMSGLYVNFLSGLSTHAVNILSNTTSLAGHVATSAVEDLVKNRGRNIPNILRALWRTATGSGLSELRETFFTGRSLHSSGDKFFPSHNVLEMQSPQFISKLQSPKARELAEKFARADYKVYSTLGGKWVGRALNAADVFFYKLAQEASFAAKGGQVETEAMRSSAIMEADRQMKSIGLDPNASKANRRKRDVIANTLVNQSRTQSDADKLAFEEAHHEALDATFRQDPKGLLGKAAKYIEEWTKGSEDSPNPLGKLLIPFTRIAANVTNQMLEWTPYGLLRYGAGHLYGEDFRLRDKNDKPTGRDPKVAYRAVMGTLGAIALMGLFGQHAKDEDPFFAIFDDGSKNPEKRRQMMDRGWRPKTIKIGRGYYSYTGTPFSMVFSIMGRAFDDWRDGKTKSQYDIGLSSSAVAMLQAVTHESFLSGLTDFMSAVDSPNPEDKLSRLMARSATSPFIPNLAKQLDKWWSPTVQQAQGFKETFMREMPVVRQLLKPSLNTFGEPIKREPGITILPGLDRFLTMEKTDDPVLNFGSEKDVTFPGFSKSTKLGNEVMTKEQYYDYVQQAGPKIKSAIAAELPQLQAMDKEQAQKRVETIARKIKENVRAEMRSHLVN